MRAAEVEANVLGPAEKRAVGEEEVGIFFEMEGWVWGVEGAGVDPGEVGGVAVADGEAGAAGSDELDERVAVFFEVG